MNVQPRVPMDKEAFLAWAQGCEGRFELVERHVVMMVGGSKTHALVASQLMRALWARIDVKKWVVLGSDLAVDVGPGSLRYPDAIVDSIGGQRALVATAPVSDRRSSFALVGNTRPRRQGRRVSATTKPRCLPRAIARRNQGLGLSEGRRPTPWPPGDHRRERCNQRLSARGRLAACGNLCRGRVRRRAVNAPSHAPWKRPARRRAGRQSNQRFRDPQLCACGNSDAGSTFTPGPIVEDTATRLMKVPLAPAGFAFCTASANALMF